MVISEWGKLIQPQSRMISHGSWRCSPNNWYPIGIEHWSLAQSCAASTKNRISLVTMIQVVTLANNYQQLVRYINFQNQPLPINLIIDLSITGLINIDIRPAPGEHPPNSAERRKNESTVDRGQSATRRAA